MNDKDKGSIYGKKSKVYNIFPLAVNFIEPNVL